MALVRPVLPHRPDSECTVTRAEVAPVRFPFAAPSPDHDGAIELKPLHRCSSCCGRESPLVVNSTIQALIVVTPFADTRTFHQLHVAFRRECFRIGALWRACEYVAIRSVFTDSQNTHVSINEPGYITVTTRFPASSR